MSLVDENAEESETTLCSPQKYYYKKRPNVNLSQAKNDTCLLGSCLKSLRWKVCNHNVGDIYWYGMSITASQIIDLCSSNKCSNYSKFAVNRYPNLQDATRKDYFYKLLQLHLHYKCNGDEHEHGTNAYPPSFTIPRDMKHIVNLLDYKIPFILKPSGGSMGQGVRVATVPEDVTDDLNDYIAQEYIANPLLLDGKKFDIRIYILLTGTFEDFSAFISKSSLVRVCTAFYEYPSANNSCNSFMHLTNYSINRLNLSQYHRGKDIYDVNNNKRPLDSVLNHLEKYGYKKKNIWTQIKQIAENVASALYPHISINSGCLSGTRNPPKLFQILGLDVIIDIYGKAWLLEVNSNPSLKTTYCDGNITRDDPVDLSIKLPVVRDFLTIVNNSLSNVDAIPESCEVIKVTIPTQVHIFVQLYKLTKLGTWTSCRITRTEWLAFCRRTKLVELAKVYALLRSHNVPQGDENHETNVTGKRILLDLFSEYRRENGVPGVCFLRFSQMLESLALIFYENFALLRPSAVERLCGLTGVPSQLLLNWSVNQPDILDKKGIKQATQRLFYHFKQQFL
ncbi:tubulin-tyrosine ligase family member protein [Theileria equi strain WA]|uniref:Tubulin-tyrosine ligase family member protein n=1 Tax=Theileria equi strain WA TaxID=1537102 RepID=L0AWL9_THEEQ|nr:tubulin-tyrosine ligase family member protein [Theileria equi strain WA]AFZ79935.1 tubulin-tyrosine ligase family member protein [Theileria equi strain WA]|eukprot:XP_004829601.1 tubulin-tyrosine ligase family member protein [Theileria equi strain WA]